MGSLALLTAFAVSIANGEIYFAAKSASHKYWPVLRGNIDFVLTHPLKVFHGHVTSFEGAVHVNPENLLAGIEVHLYDKVEKISFDEAYAAKIVSANAPLNWDFHSRVIEPRGTAEDGQQAVDFVGTLRVGEQFGLVRIPMKCALDLKVLRCRDQSTTTFAKFSWAPPKVLFFPVSNTFHVNADFAFGEKKGGE